MNKKKYIGSVLAALVITVSVAGPAHAAGILPDTYGAAKSTIEGIWKRLDQVLNELYQNRLFDVYGNYHADNQVPTSGLKDGAVTSAKIGDGEITNADIATAAAIADGKLATISTVGKVADTALSSNVPLKNAANSFSAGQTVTAGGITVTGNSSIAGTLAGLTGLTVGASGTSVTQVRVFAPSLTPVATAAAVGTTQQTFTVTGLATTDKLVVNGPAPSSLCPVTGYRVSAVDTLQLDFTTLTAAACTPAAGVYNVVAIRS